MSPCAQCGREGVQLKCSRCKIAHYCDRRCQAQDWSKHKPRCKLPEAAAAGRFQSSERMVLREVETAKDTTKTIPVAEMFPVQLREFEYRCSPDGVDENLLILLHGNGDSHKEFGSFAQKLKLPQTAWLALSGPIKLPEEIIKGSLWFEIYDDEWNPLPTGDRKRVDSLETTRRLLEAMMQALCCNCGWPRSRMFLFGYADGGTVVMHHTLHSCGPTRLGGAVSISGPILPELVLKGDQHTLPACKEDCTPVLITYGTRADQEHQSDMDSTKRFLHSRHRSPQAKVVGLDKGQEMVRTPDEARVLHQFFADYLSRRMVNMENNSTLYEVTKS